MKTLFKRRIDTEAKRRHWAIQLAFKNLPIVAAYMIVLDHVKTDLTCLDDTMPILSPNTDCFLLCNTFAQLEGAYLYYNTNLGAFIRSGKVNGQCFSVKHQEHENKSKEKYKQQLLFFVSIRRSSKPKIKVQARCIPLT